jgi:hypothetical protein
MIRTVVLVLLGVAIVLAGVGCGRGGSTTRNDMPVKASAVDEKTGKRMKTADASLEETPPPPKR